jgi:hypothetical protein
MAWVIARGLAGLEVSAYHQAVGADLSYRCASDFQIPLPGTVAGNAPGRVDSITRRLSGALRHVEQERVSATPAQKRR